MSKKRSSTKKRNSTTSRQSEGVKPFFMFLMLVAFIALAFYLGTLYDDYQGTLNPQANETLQVSPTPAAPASASTATATPVPVQSETVQITLYFPNSNADSVVPHQRQVKVQKGEMLEKVIFTELQKGIEGNATRSFIPEGSKLLSVETKDGICYLNLSSEFVENNPGGTAYEGMLINSIVNSLTELSYVKKVQFLIEGEKREVYTHAIFDEPFERNQGIIRTADNTSEAIEEKLRKLGNEALTALRDGDMASLSALVHPNKKLRFSPYTYVNVEKDLTFSAAELKELLKSEKVYTWGDYDGIGDPIMLTFKEYIEEFVYNKDFLNANEIGYNRFIGQGNTQNNILEVYPQGHLLEYHFPGFDAQYEGMDWESLKLIFEEKDGKWYLVGIVHDQWTI